MKHLFLGIIAFPLSISAVLADGARVTGSQPAAPAAAFVSMVDMERVLEGLSPKFTDDEALRVIDAGTNRLGIFVVGRPKRTGPAQVEPNGAVHVTEGLQLDQVSVVVRILEGAGTFVAGGTLIAPQRMRPDDPDAEVIGPGLRGRAILYGQRRRLTAGDMVIVPAAVAHGFSEIEAPLRYIVIRVDTGHVLPLK